MSPHSIAKTAFITPDGHYELNVLGLHLMLLFLVFPKFYSNKLAPQLVKSNVKTFCSLQLIQKMS
jgi:hypothetical protein